MRLRDFVYPMALAVVLYAPGLARADDKGHGHGKDKGEKHAKAEAKAEKKHEKFHEKMDERLEKHGEDFDRAVEEHERFHRETAARRGVGMRFRGMDTNDDGIVTRREWRGNDVSFAAHDWNGDGVLSGNEVRPGAQPPAVAVVPGAGRREARFRELDHDNDGIISRGEWHGSGAEFRRLDRNRDGVLSWPEFTR
ncbi:MAG TPA: hypothetical protein VGQ78_03290 [Vicinamibacteria bacterium]|jgi:hypothetical protein|nr:hypothetical protein [Vicinamibacteria bacterium]